MVSICILFLSIFLAFLLQFRCLCLDPDEDWSIETFEVRAWEGVGFFGSWKQHTNRMIQLWKYPANVGKTSKKRGERKKSLSSPRQP